MSRGWEAGKPGRFSVVPWRVVMNHFVAQKKGSFFLESWGVLSLPRTTYP